MNIFRLLKVACCLCVWQETEAQSLLAMLNQLPFSSGRPFICQLLLECLLHAPSRCDLGTFLITESLNGVSRDDEGKVCQCFPSERAVYSNRLALAGFAKFISGA